MMNFIKWLILDSWFHLLILLSGIAYMLTWGPALDKNIGLLFFSVILIVLIIGKFRYWRKNNP
jgi:hypothetical protein